MIDLCRDRPHGNRFRERVAPQIAHQTAKRAFPVGEKNSGHWYNHSPVRILLFYEIFIRKVRIAFLSRRAEAQDPAIHCGVHGYSDRNFWRYSASRNGSLACIVLSATAPCWKRRLENTGISNPVTALTPRDTISPFNRYSRSTS